MEKSVKPYSGKSGKLIPALLLVSALFCISWLGIQRNTSTAALQVPAQDTIRPGKENVARYSRKRIITTDEHGQPHEEIVEEFQGDEDLRPLLENGLMPNQPVSSDSIPPVPFNMDAEQWEAFSEAFHENFNINFPDVVFGGEDLMAWVKEFEERFNANAEWPDSSLQFNLQPGAFGGQYNFDSLALKDFDKQFQRLHELQIEHFKNLNPNFGLPGNAWLQHEKTLRQHLVEDGYLSKDERIESMQWSDNSFKVNGKSIRKADREKYRSLYDQFMNGTIAQSVD